MYEQTLNFWDIVIVTTVVVLAGFYVYKKLFGKKAGCGGGCTSCGSSVKKKE